jgi:hypothetical protein
MTSWVVRTTAEELEKMHTGTRRIVTKQELLEQYAVPSAYRTYFRLVQEL